MQTLEVWKGKTKHTMPGTSGTDKAVAKSSKKRTFLGLISSLAKSSTVIPISRKPPTLLRNSLSNKTKRTDGSGGTKPNCNKSRLNGFKSRYLRIKASTTYLYFSNHKVSTPRTGI